MMGMAKNKATYNLNVNLHVYADEGGGSLSVQQGFKTRPLDLAGLGRVLSAIAAAVEKEGKE